MRFLEGSRYFSEDNFEMVVIGRRENYGTGSDSGGPRIFASFGFTRPAYYKIRKDRNGDEYAVIKGHHFNSV